MFTYSRTNQPNNDDLTSVNNQKRKVSNLIINKSTKFPVNSMKDD